MPQVDLETLVCGGGGDGKVVCESLIRGGPRPDPPSDDPDLPAESFQLPIEDEIYWVDRNAAYYDRDDSTKGTTNPKSHHSNPIPSVKLHSNSQRFSGNLKPKPPIIGVPKLQHSGYLGSSARKTGRQAPGRIFPKKPGPPGGKSAVPESEPGSPKVSCFGKVLSERERDRFRTIRRGENPHEATERTGFWARAFRFSCCGENQAVECVDEEAYPEPSKKKNTAAVEAKDKVPSAGDAAVVAPGLGGMKRFASGRRAASWGGDVDLGLGGHVEALGPLDRDRILGRRSVGSLEDVEIDRDWECAGPAST